MEDRNPPPSPRSPDEPDDGVRITTRPAGGRMRTIGVVAIVVLAAFVGYRLLVARAAPRGAQPGVASDAGASNSNAGALSAAAAAASAGRAVASRNTSHHPGARAFAVAVDGEDPTPDLSDHVLPGEAPSMARVIEGLHRRGIRSGLGAFQPPGTSPPLLGLEVPEGFALPEGYVRHQQATDDGQRIAPILMFSPDLQFIDVQGRRVPVPANRVVPPSLAPAGMPLRQVRIPPPRDGSSGP